MIRHRIVTISWAVALVLAFGSVGRCDIHMKQRTTSDAPTAPGETAAGQETVSEVWITAEGFRSDNPKTSMFMTLNSDQMTVLDHAKKTYLVMPVNITEMMDEAMADAAEEEKAMFQGFMKNMMKMTASVTPTEERKKIGAWNCRKYLMTLTTMMGPINQEIWASEDIKIDPQVYERLRRAQNAMMPGMQESLQQMESEMKKIKGVQVASTSTSKMMNRTITTQNELLEFQNQAQAPAGLFSIPQDYQQAQR